MIFGNCIEMFNVELLEGNIDEVKAYVGDFLRGIKRIKYLKDQRSQCQIAHLAPGECCLDLSIRH